MVYERRLVIKLHTRDAGELCVCGYVFATRIVFGSYLLMLIFSFRHFQEETILPAPVQFKTRKQTRTLILPVFPFDLLSYETGKVLRFLIAAKVKYLLFAFLKVNFVLIYDTSYVCL